VHKKLFGLSLSLLSVALAVPTANAADSGCPGQWYVTEPEWKFCTLKRGSTCSQCTYDCGNGEETYNMCQN
jgi:hypothetical protein